MSSAVATKPTFSAEQQRAIDAIVTAANAGESGFHFITGKAGTGKSTILRAIRHQVRNVVVLSPTGLAALNVHGQTIHSFFGFKPGPLVPNRGRLISGQNVQVAACASIIIIDEVSMVRSDMLSAMDEALRNTLRDDRPFGGKLVVAFGDPCQLSPVITSEDGLFIQQNFQSGWFFDALPFERMSIDKTELSQVFRQAGDPAFIDALNGVRLGDPSGLEVFNSRFQPIPEPGVVTLAMTNARVKAINDIELRNLPGESQLYQATITGDCKDHPCDPELELKVGAQVMVAKNIRDDNGELVANGSIGTVTRLGLAPMVELRDGRHIRIAQQNWEKTAHTYDAKTKEIDEKVTGGFIQIPLKLAWAMTIHKSQGQSMDAAHIEFENHVRNHGQVYVALSRIRTLLGMTLSRKLTARDLYVDPRVVRFMSPDHAPAVDFAKAFGQIQMTFEGVFA